MKRVEKIEIEKIRAKEAAEARSICEKCGKNNHVQGGCLGKQTS
jgi:hypothetical protein